MNRRELIIGGTLASLAAKVGAATPDRRCEVVELRQYTLHAHRRDDLIDLFDREFIDPQEALGIRVLGQFRDLDDPDRFVWMRGFTTMGERGRLLPLFYHGDVWRSRREQANATMLDSDNVLLLRPTAGSFEPPLPGAAPQSRIVVGLHYLGDVDSGSFAAFFGSAMAPALALAGGELVGEFVSERGPNNFPGLPIRERDHVYTWIARLSGEPAERAFFAKLRLVTGWRDGSPAELLPAFMRKPEILRLAPTPMSKLR